MANEPFVKGTKEYYVVDLLDRLQNVDDLATDATSWKYDTYDPSGVLISDDLNATPQTMRLLCLIDTTDVAYVEGTTGYRLFVQLIIGPESPRIGPFLFDIIVGH